ncbi:MAG: tartrate dehydrogenase, partial [Mesorhizobium sp.]
AQMLEHLGESAVSVRLMNAVESVTREGVLTPDVGGTATTQEVTDAVCRTIRGSNV